MGVQRLGLHTEYVEWTHHQLRRARKSVSRISMCYTLCDRKIMWEGEGNVQKKHSLPRELDHERRPFFIVHDPVREGDV